MAASGLLPNEPATVFLDLEEVGGGTTSATGEVTVPITIPPGVGPESLVTVITKAVTADCVLVTPGSPVVGGETGLPTANGGSPADASRGSPLPSR